MRVWMLSQFQNAQIGTQADEVAEWPVAASYSNGHVCPLDPSTPDGWALVLCDSTGQQMEAAAQDPRVQPYRTPWDVITPETLTAYAGATSGMMLCQLLSLLAQQEAGFAGGFSV